MKLRVGIMLAMLITGFSTQASVRQEIEGFWTNVQKNVSVEVRQTYDGIKVKRRDRSQWISYEKMRSNQYRDRQGNTYYLRTDGLLEWESYDGRKRLRFNRASNPQSYSRDLETDRDIHIERNHYYGGSLEGRWINQSTGQIVQVKTRRKTIRVKAHRGGWVTFRPRSNQSFVDDRGNRYRVQHGKLIYTSYSGDFMMRFVRY